MIPRVFNFHVSHRLNGSNGIRTRDFESMLNRVRRSLHDWHPSVISHKWVSRLQSDTQDMYLVSDSLKYPHPIVGFWTSSMQLIPTKSILFSSICQECSRCIHTHARYKKERQNNGWRWDRQRNKRMHGSKTVCAHDG